MSLCNADALNGSNGVMLEEELHFVVPHTRVWCDVFGVQNDPSTWITPFLVLFAIKANAFEYIKPIFQNQTQARIVVSQHTIEALLDEITVYAWRITIVLLVNTAKRDCNVRAFLRCLTSENTLWIDNAQCYTKSHQIIGE